MAVTQKGIHGGFRLWKVEMQNDDLRLTCSKCGSSTIVNAASWLEGAGLAVGSQTRPCPYCFKVSRIPPPDSSHSSLT